jgi:hypothetical protein
MSEGTDLKINVHIETVSGLTMDRYNFECLFYTSSLIKSIRVKKENMVRIDSQNYIAVVDSSKIGYGRLNMKITAYIPDQSIYYRDGIRKEVKLIENITTIDK